MIPNYFEVSWSEVKVKMTFLGSFHVLQTDMLFSSNFPVSGEMVVNNKDRYTGESPGYFTGLDLTKNMYLGSVPDYNNIPQAAGFKEGFVGKVWLKSFSTV